ncbi:MAG: glycosyltransferase family 39 protein, partial [Terriglobia bacterium]
MVLLSDTTQKTSPSAPAAGAGRQPQHSSVYISESSRLEVGIVLLLFVATCLYLRLFYHYTNLDADEGVILQGAQRILNGEVPYRDFFSFFTPGSYYWMALLFKVFGDSILVARAALIVYGGLFSVLTYLLARRVCSRGTALFTVYLLTLTCLPYCFLALHNWD